MDGLKLIILGGDVRNRSSWPHPKKFLIPSWTSEKCFLFGRNWFFRSLPRLLWFFSIFPLKLLWAWFFKLISTSNWARTSNGFSNCSFCSPEQDKCLIRTVQLSKSGFFDKKQIFLLIFWRNRKISYFRHLWRTTLYWL